ncbi:MAG: Na(+)-translocating NADH-quinone reductase subunit A [Gammaproteobacteria bacterium]|nr:Na(+)-translocating NADH-quinone reductase subunit A [Gammaproteobacteria bacterium]MBT8104495.1 Na(+)-translocating NADH-quinone reductase subunit A [Gammaproteobacteria bacterium]NNF49879.1 Na(+)-translocating NADH-quinone reductase subunit A [Woeseiaceae bacterium]NNK24509.1 Na(+)-translocating NADH-quinone reductase subunit A [Woeseiaceae bacterium]NNL64266.1 Na(+)-translocating NADH-quinone reductase subunit A [Woeseiaceae bacterium]
MHIKIRKGLDIPVSGAPAQTVGNGPEVSSVALLGPDTHDLKPRMLVREGDRVKLGTPIFQDKSNPGVTYTAPGCGTVAAVNRGERRILQSVVIDLDGDDAEDFASYRADELAGLEGQAVRDNLLGSGLWTALRTRPFSRIPAPDAEARSIFVTAIDTNPLAADPAVIIGRDPEAFANGLTVLSHLTDGPVYVCTAHESGITVPGSDKFRHAEFSGPHPAGLAGTHIHFLDPVSETKIVWHIGYQDVIAYGKLFTSGRLSVDLVVSIAGPKVLNPRLITTRLGANTNELIRGEVEAGDVRVVSGSVLNGHRAAGWASYLGRYDDQLSVLQEGHPREFLEFARPGRGKFSLARAYVGKLFGTGYKFTTSQNGSPRAMVSIGSFERVMPLDVLPTPLLKALLVRDTDGARDLGCLELDEEDLALCSFVCNGKYEYGPHLRNTLHEIEVNG